MVGFIPLEIGGCVQYLSLTMRHRYRIPIALVALLTLLVSTTGAMWASVCAPEMPGVSGGAAPASVPMPPGCGEHDSSAPAPDPGDSGSDTVPCPLLALGTAGSCVPASLPARAAWQPDVPVVRDALVPRAEAAPDLLDLAPPFHPPKP